MPNLGVCQIGLCIQNRMKLQVGMQGSSLYGISRVHPHLSNPFVLEGVQINEMLTEIIIQTILLAHYNLALGTSGISNSILIRQQSISTKNNE